MKLFLNILLIMFAQSVLSQIELDQPYLINQIPGSDLTIIQEMNLTKIDDSKGPMAGFGNKIIFYKDGTFKSFYTSFCGNDCFPSSTGTFKLIDSEHIKIYIKEFKQTGECKLRRVKLNKDLGKYSISKMAENKIKLSRIE